MIKNGDSINLIKDIKSNSIHLILSDIPYGISFDAWDVLHNNSNSALLGTSPAQKKSSNFIKRGKPLNGWSQADKNISKEYYKWCCSWAAEWNRVLMPGASCFIFAGRRYAHRCIEAMEDSGFIFKDMIAWEKNNASYKAQKISSVFERRKDYENAEIWEDWKIGNLRPLFEPILWFMKPYPIGSTLTDNVLKYNVGAFNETVFKNTKELKNNGVEICSNIIKIIENKEDHGLHPNQKPLALLEFLIKFTTKEGQVVLDPFCGSGSTLVAAKKCNRQYIGFENNTEYFQIAKKRMENI